MLASVFLAGLVSLSGVIATSDNRHSSGLRVGRELFLSLDARWGMWYPDGRRHAGIPMLAFAEEGKPLQIPGPLIRVPQRTEIVLRVHNSIPGNTLTLHGLITRPGDQDKPFTVAAGVSRTVRFRLNVPGTYAYWAATNSREPISNHLGWDSQLGGVIVVDPPDARSVNDRIFVITSWLNVFNKDGTRVPRYALDTINGLAWPYTERLTYAKGQLVRWRWINLGAVSHPLHLHGFYFRVDSRGDGLSDTIYPLADRDAQVTELIRQNATFSISWKASRSGNWLFHCHIPAHTVAHLPVADMLSGRPKITLAQYLNDYVPHTGMGNLVLGITIKPHPATVAPEPRVARKLTLTIESRPENTPAAPAFRYVISDGTTQLSERGYVGPPLVLTQGVPVQIDVQNRLQEITSVHWHGMELGDSFYDGVGGFSGDEQRRAPMIEPGGSFVVSFTPPRTGTFAYHAHMHDLWQFRGGLAGPLIVIPPGGRFDPTSDHIIMLTSPRTESALLSSVLINGARSPAPLLLRVGILHRLRLINLTVVNAEAVVSLESSSGPVYWRPRAIDGADLSASRRNVERAVHVLTIGQTRDFEFTPATVGDLFLVIRSKARGLVLGTLPIHVIDSYE